MSDPAPPEPIAIVGVACEYPDAPTPARLWDNVLASRRAFRRLPPERLRLDDYWSPDRAAEDRLYATEAALIEGYAFDRVRFRVPGAAFRAADLTHWLALDVACRALADAGFAEGGGGLPRETTGVLLGNTLTGELSRAGLMRLRWPYVRRVVGHALREQALEPAVCDALLARIEAAYKAPFVPIGDESLAGALSNTIAGRVCNHLDLGGGGYTVDGACAASLLAVITACERLTAGALDVAVAGGVDISLDPFELVGFSKAGALATDEMRVYDVRSQGFWPGEGCGVVVLMRADDARATGARVHALVRGWGVSSDGSGGITRPEVTGQLRAIRRAYRCAGVDARAIALFEGHGTGTAVGDAAELRALAAARGDAEGDARPAAVGSIKANIGHTKAAAGVAGLIKATLALREGVIPPTTGCVDPHPELLAGRGALRAVERGEAWPGPARLAGVSAMGFGGIDTHVVLAAAAPVRERTGLDERERLLLSSAQDAELFVLAGATHDELAMAVERLRARAAGLSLAELGDAAAALAGEGACGRVRAAVVASRPAELAERLDAVTARLRDSAADATPGVFVGTAARTPRIGFLLPGQGTAVQAGGGALRRRFPFVEDLFAGAGPEPSDPVDTAFAQPAIVTASLAALRVLAALGLEAEVAVGHSLGELTALVWSGALDEAAGRRIATARGRLMAELGEPGGAMAGVALDRAAAASLAGGLPLAVAGVNSPGQTVLSGPAHAIDALLERARARRVPASRLRVSHAFHSPLMASVEGALEAVLARERFATPRRRVVSTVTGAPLTAADDLPGLLCRQLTAPVRFADAAVQAAAGLDLLIEAGPGRVLGELAAGFLAVPVAAVDAGGPSLAGVLSAAGAAWALGAPLDTAPLFAQRFTRPIELDRPPRLFANPCETAPHDAGEPVAAPARVEAPPDAPAPRDPLELVRDLLAARAELPLAAVTGDSRLLDDLHLNSIVVSEIAAEAARRLGRPPPLAPSEFANATVAVLAASLADGEGSALETQRDADPPGAGPWTRAFAVEAVASPRREHAANGGEGRWTLIARPDHPIAGALAQALEQDRRGGFALCLPEEPDEQDLPLLLGAARAVLAEAAPRRLLVVQRAGGGGGFARALHLEAPDVATCVVDVSFDERGAARAAAEAAAHRSGFVEAWYGLDGVRREPVLRHLPLRPHGDRPPLRDADVVLVAGGAKGIAAECLLALADGRSPSVVFLGRSDPATDPVLAANLERCAARGVRVRYLQTDVTRAEDVAAAVGEVECALGPVTALLHAAGRNEPALLADLDEAQLRDTVAPKVAGLRHLLGALGGLRLLVTFGSVIAVSGLRGEAHYALANEWQTLLTRRFAATHPACRCVALESSVWSSVGMGERLGSVAALARHGVAAIPPEAGAETLARLVADAQRPVAVVVSGRLGHLPTVRRERRELPVRRFLERPRVEYPGVELVADVDLLSDVDPYLADHVLDGEQVLPAVIGLEAMAQAVMALTGAGAPPAFEDVRLERSLVAPPGERTTIRVAVLADDDGTGRAVVRSGRTGFHVDHFSARWRVGVRADDGGDPPPPPPPAAAGGGPAPEELYGWLLFQGGRFRRLRGYRSLRATECVAEVEAKPPAGWFGAFLPQELVLGDPGARDAALHALQACVPHARVVPIGIASLRFLAPAGPGLLIVHARERAREPGEFTFDIAIRDAAGALLERWDGVRLRAIAPIRPPAAWPKDLLATYLERRLEGLDPTLRVAVAVDGGARRDRSDAAIRRALGSPVAIRRRPDGRPEAATAIGVSTAHADGMTLAVGGGAPVACDVEPAVTRPGDDWRDLLGVARSQLSETIAAERGEDVSVAATRVWAAAECLQKAGLPVGAPLTLSSSADDGWLLLSCGDRAIATYVTHVCEIDPPVAVAVLAGGSDARL